MTAKIRTPQTKFFDLLVIQAETDGFEVVVDYAYSNVGTIHFQRPDSFETALSVPFSFQPGEKCLSLGNANASFDGSSPVVLFPDRPNPKFAGFKVDELGYAITAILAAAEVA